MRMLFLKIHEWFFLLAGVGMLTSLPLFGEEAIPFWTLAKIFYFIGIVFFIFDFINKKSDT